MADAKHSLFIRAAEHSWTFLGLFLFSLIATILSLANPAGAEDLPDKRPALVGSGKAALINRIDTQALVRQGVNHAAVMFDCFVRPTGSTYGGRAYGGTPNSDALKREVQRQLDESRFIPAVVGHHHCYAQFCGTVTFSVIDGKPHLRIFSTHDKSELSENSDFIDPQSIFLVNHRYDRTEYPAGTWDTEQRPATVEIELSVDAQGNIKNVRALSENPPGKKFGEQAVKNIRNNTFLPAFRNGHPVDSTTHYTYIFVPNNYRWKP